MLAVFLAESEENKGKAVNEIINSAIALLIENEKFPSLVDSDEEISAFILTKFPTKVKHETTENNDLPSVPPIKGVRFQLEGKEVGF